MTWAFMTLSGFLLGFGLALNAASIQVLKDCQSMGVMRVGDTVITCQVEGSK